MTANAAFTPAQHVARKQQATCCAQLVAAQQVALV